MNDLSRLASQEKSYEESNKHTEDKYNNIKENAKLVDDIRDEIRTLENKKRSKKITLSSTHTKTTETDNILKSTFDPLKGYLKESANVGSRVKQALEKKESYVKLKDKINMAVIEVLEEVTKVKKNQNLQVTMNQMKQETEKLKQQAKDKMLELKNAQKPKE